MVKVTAIKNVDCSYEAANESQKANSSWNDENCALSRAPVAKDTKCLVCAAVGQP